MCPWGTGLGMYIYENIYLFWVYAATYPKIWGLPYPLLTILNLTTGIIIFDILLPRAFRKYTTPMVFLEFLKNPTYPKIRGLPYPLLTILNLATGIIIFDILSPRAFRKYTTPMVFHEFLKNPTYPKIWGLSAYPDTTRHHQTPPDTHQTISDRLAVVLC